MTAREVGSRKANNLRFLLVFDRRLKCRPARRSAGQKGAEKLDRASTVGCHKQIGLKCTGNEPSIVSRATAVRMARQRSMRRTPLTLSHMPPNSVMAWGSSDPMWQGSSAPCREVCGVARLGRDHAPQPVSCIARGTACRLSVRRLKTRTRELDTSAQHGTGLTVTAGDGRYRGRSSRSSQRAGKPHTGRRRAGRRQSLAAEE